MLREVLYFEDVIYRLESLMVYDKIQNDDVLQALCELSKAIAENKPRESMTSKYYAFAKKLLVKAEEMGFSGHLLKQHVLYLFLMDSNTLSVSCNNGIDVYNSTLFEISLKDIGVLQYLMDFDLKNLCENAGYGENLYDYLPSNPKEYPELEQLGSLKKATDLLDRFIWYYTHMGCGDLPGTSMFRVDERGGLIAVRNRSEVSFSSIIGYKRQIEVIKENTEAFLKGSPSNTLLLTGNSGIGKYLCLSALADQYTNRDLRLVEVGKNRFCHIEKLLTHLSLLRNNKFILISDELEPDDILINYDSLKYLLGRSLEARPKNVLFYACSNHKTPAKYFDEVVEFREMTEREFQDAVISLAKIKKVMIPTDFLREQALIWVSDKHERSAATAREYIKQVMWELNNS